MKAANGISNLISGEIEKISMAYVMSIIKAAIIENSEKREINGESRNPRIMKEIINGESGWRNIESSVA